MGNKEEKHAIETVPCPCARCKRQNGCDKALECKSYAAWRKQFLRKKR